VLHARSPDFVDGSSRLPKGRSRTHRASVTLARRSAVGGPPSADCRRSRPEDLFAGQWQARTLVLDEYKPTSTTAGMRAAPTPGNYGKRSSNSAIRGGYQRVRASLRQKRTSPRPVMARPPSPRAVAGWILRRPVTLSETEHLHLKNVRANCPEIDTPGRHVRSFAAMLTERQGERLPDWLDAVRQDNLPSLRTLAAGIDRDRDAVIAGLTLPWNSGVVEGHVNRIKMLKRQMFGRAGFKLLRKRVLLYT